MARRVRQQPKVLHEHDLDDSAHGPGLDGLDPRRVRSRDDRAELLTPAQMALWERLEPILRSCAREGVPAEAVAERLGVPTVVVEEYLESLR